MLLMDGVCLHRENKSNKHSYKIGHLHPINKEVLPFFDKVPFLKCSEMFDAGNECC